ncbi:MAG: carbohydrate ABC transporter permease [Arcanobacterium sp.]|nr:carbohydrate ABC transporter permease [Arcanobacterium sp.]MDY5588933.1 carbohydrate ABC transporter permease [Arcanobacterium sp.]
MTAVKEIGRRLKPGRIAGWAAIIVLIFITLCPFVWALRTALIPNAQIFSGDYSLITSDMTLINFKRVLGLVSVEEDLAAGGSGATMYFWLYLRNSVIFTLLLVAGQVATSSMAAYAFARLRFPGRNVMFAVLLSGMMIPPIFIVLPNFVLIKDLNLLNTFVGLLAPYFFVSPFAIFFLRQFFLSIPREVEEAAKLDGAGYWRTFVKVVVPMSSAPITTVGIIQAVFAWNEYLWPQLVGKEHSVRLLNVALAVFQQASPSTRPDWAGLMAAAMLQMLPMLIVLLVFGKKLIGSIGLTSAK